MIIPGLQYHTHMHVYTPERRASSQFDHLEWLLNGTVFLTGTVGATSLQLLILPVTFSHAGHWECKAVLSDGTTPEIVGAGTLTVFGESYKSTAE